MLGTLVRRGLRKGIVEGSRPWLAVGVAAGLVAIVRRVTSQPPETVWRAPLKPGEGVLISVREPEPT
ncbi:MAG: hypothetical protein HYU28_03595 [Actinobacteria bacterium]|nr:hypothetical protein [Actinomycetota bacterium]